MSKDEKGSTNVKEKEENNASADNATDDNKEKCPVCGKEFKDATAHARAKKDEAHIEYMKSLDADVKDNKETKPETDAKDKPAKEVKKGSVSKAEVGIDLTKDGKAPLAIIFECDCEMVVRIEWEYMDGTRGTHRVDAFPLSVDTMGKGLKKSEVKGRAFTNAYCIPAKRIISCNAKKIYMIH